MECDLYVAANITFSIVKFYKKKGGEVLQAEKFSRRKNFSQDADYF